MNKEYTREVSRLLAVVLIVNLVLFLPCCIFWLANIFSINIWNRFIIFAVPFGLARIYYINYIVFILAIVMQIIYFFKCNKWRLQYNYKISKLRKITYITIWLILIIGVIFGEYTFDELMSV